MATWKKLVVSGSNISQLNNDAQYISASQVPAAANAFSTASINGVELLADSNQGNFNIVTGSAGTGLTITGTAGTDTISFDLSAIPNSTLENDSVHISGSGISLASVALGATASIDVQVDDSTIEIVSDSLQLKDGGITFDKLADALVVTAAEGIANNDNDTTIATNAAIIDYVESASAAAGALSVGGDGTTSTSVDLDTQTLEFVGSDGIALSASAQTITATINDGGIANAKLTNDSITIGDDTVALGGSTTLAATGFNSGSFSGSFEGDGQGLTGIASILNIDSDTGGPSTVNLLDETLDIAGGDNINTEVAGQTITVNLNSNISVTDAIVSGDLTVLGTASFQHETNLEVADRFILLASGSGETGDGGIIVQQATQNIGEVFGFDGITGETRWGIGQNQHASGSSFTPDAFMAAVLEGTADTATNIEAAFDSRYSVNGNIYVDTSKTQDTDANIWIYA